MNGEKQTNGKNVVVFLNNDKGEKQPDDFRCCPLGLQFYSEKPIPEYTELEFSLETDGDPICCTGVVVHNRNDQTTNNRNRIWVMFLDVPESERNKLTCTARASDYLCPYCENF